MKISIDSSSFSFPFIGIVLVILSIIIFLFFSRIVGIALFGLAVVCITKKNFYVIPKKSILVIQQVEKTLTLLSIGYKRMNGTFITKTTSIEVDNFLTISTLHFKFGRMYNKQGRYLTTVIVKYQRYT